jgi:iron complex outermembrane recepter protein
VRASYGSYNQIDLVGSVAVPLGAGLAAGGAVAWLQRDGFGTNLTTGNEHYNKDVLAGRVSLEYEPTADLFFRLSGDWIQDNSNARHGSRLTGNAGLADFAPLASVYDTRAGAGDRNRVRTRGTSFTGEYRATPEVTLKSITAYRDGETRGQIDFDNAPGPVLDIPAFYEDEQFSQEVQLVYEGNTVQGVAGLFYLDSEAAGAFDTVLGLANLTIFTTGSVKTRSIAGFADMNINLSPFWRVSLGGRYTSDRRTGTVYRQNFTGIRSPFFGNNAAVPGLVRSNFTNTRTDDQFTPRASISWLPDRDTTLYASYSKGFKAGGFDMRSDVILVPQAVRGYEPETVDAYEVGLKTYLFDRSLYLSFAAFYSDYQNQQFTVQVPVGANVASMVENAGDSRIFGVEAEWRAVVTDNFSVSGMFGYTDARFKRLTTFDPVQQRFVDRSNEWVFQNTPRFTFAVSPTISTDLAGGTLAFTPSMSFRSEYSQFEIPNPLLDEDGYVLVDASLVWTSPDQRFQISAHGRNLLDERYRIGGYNFPGALFGNSIIGFYGPPRTFTITGQVRF